MQRKSILLLLAVLIVAFGAAAQARGHKNRLQSSGHEAQFDYYVLSLSWAPSFCRVHRDNSDECASPHGFVLHGLWPQFAAGGYPQTCGGRQLTNEEQQAGTTIYPSAQLAAHEWSKHGTCSGMSPAAYFKTANDARDAVAIPEALQAGNRTAKLRAADIVRVIRASNPQIPTRAIAVSCAGHAMTEVRICLDRDLSPRECGPDVRSSCGTDIVQVPGAH
jgi:ribonuclease T2